LTKTANFWSLPSTKQFPFSTTYTGNYLTKLKTDFGDFSATGGMGGAKGQRCEIPTGSEDRPKCVDGLCCGAAFNPGKEDDLTRTQIELCEDKDATTI